MPRLSISEATDALKRGTMIILVDDEDRENEGDLYMAAEMTEPDDINFMATQGRGLICLTLARPIMSALEIPPMVSRNRSRFGTNFHASIEARDGITTGISTADRAKTIRTAVADGCLPEDIVSPGHIFPLLAQDGGVLVRSGQTEGSVDLCRIAGLKPAGVICEIMNADGTMARMDELEVFSAKHEIGILTIADIISHRLQSEQLVEHSHDFDAMPPPLTAPCKATQYRSRVDDTIYTALSFGERSSDDHASTLVRMHRARTRDDLFASEGGTLHRSLKKLEAAYLSEKRHGVLVYISDATDCLSKQLRALPNEQVLREFGLGAQVLRELGLTRIELITTKQQKYAGLSGYGLEICGYTAP